MKNSLFCAVLTVLCVSAFAWAQPSLSEPPEFPDTIPGPSASHPGFNCFHLAHGMIEPGDVDWVQVSIGMATQRTVVDVDFVGAESSAMLASVVGGGTGFNIDDNNNSLDAFCGLSGDTDPIGSLTDSAASVGATPRNTVVDVGITGAEDTAFRGAHSRTFEYDVWVYVLPEPCTQDADCDDGVACTIDTCQVGTGLCEHSSDSAWCDNGLFCDGPEVCDPVLGCRPGDPPACDDGVDCTIDRCDVSLDACVSVADDAACEDATFCNGVEFCDTTLGCLSGPEPCATPYCDEVGDRCVDCVADADCDDGVFCNGAEVCDFAGLCAPGANPCDAGQVCDPATDQCVVAEGGLTLDLKPGACPNTFKPDGHGYLHAALVAVDGFDVTDVDLASLALSRADGVGGVVFPVEGPPGPHTVAADVTAPMTGSPCACEALPADGWLDLLMKFDGQEVVDAFLLVDERPGNVVELAVSGVLTDGSAFAVTDCVTIKDVKRRGR